MTAKKSFLLLGLILLIGGLFRFTLLGSIPAGIHPDAAANALDAWNAFKNHHHQVFYESNFGREGLFINLVSYSFQLFGAGIVAYKLPGVLLGLLSVFGMFWLGREVSGRRSVGLLASFFTAISFWLIVFDRTGFRATLSVDALIWASFFFLRALRLNHWKDYLFSGIFIGIGLNSYTSFRIFPLALAAVFVAQVIIDRFNTHRSLKEVLRLRWGFLLTAGVAALLFTPLGIYYLHHPDAFTGRATMVSVFDQPHTLQLLGESTGANLSIFTFFGDPNWRHNFSTLPLLDAVQSILLFVGVWLAVRRLRRQKVLTATSAQDQTAAWFMVVVLVAMIVPAAVTYSPGGIPHALRIIDSAPMIYLLVAVAGGWILDGVLRTFSGHRRTIMIWVGVICAYLTLLNATLYFVRWGMSPQVSHEYAQDYTQLGQYMNRQAKDGKTIYLISNSSEIDYFTLQTPHLEKASRYVAETPAPNLIVYTNAQSGDQTDITMLRAQGWKDADTGKFGDGSHAIVVLEWK